MATLFAFISFELFVLMLIALLAVFIFYLPVVFAVMAGAMVLKWIFDLLGVF